MMKVFRPRFKVGSASVETTLLVAVIEHVEVLRQAIAEVYRVRKLGGWIAIASYMNFPIRSHPCDYLRFTPEGFRGFLRCFCAVAVDQAGDDSLNPQSVVAVGFKEIAPSIVVFATELRHWKTRFSRGWRHSLKPFWTGLRCIRTNYAGGSFLKLTGGPSDVREAGQPQPAQTKAR